jgi:hypothetical protein
MYLPAGGYGDANAGTRAFLWRPRFSKARVCLGFDP